MSWLALVVSNRPPPGELWMRREAPIPSILCRMFASPLRVLLTITMPAVGIVCLGLIGT